MISREKNQDFFKLLEDVKQFSHAYLIETNSLEEAFPLVVKLGKKIICQNTYKIEENCKDCNVCHLIDEGIYSDFYVINPLTVGINKEEIEKLLKVFQTKSLNENGKRVYLVYGFERCDEYISNKILKFLEEPAPNIYALLMTENANKILPTIKSRCQSVKLKVDNVVVSSEKKEKVIKFLDFLFKNKTETIAYINELWFDSFIERTDVSEGFLLIEEVLLEEINLRYNGESNFFSCLGINNLLNVVKITENLNKIMHNNVNLNLIMDRFIIEVSNEIDLN